MKSVPAWLRYSVLRVLLFAVPFAVLMIAGVTWWLSAVVAALFGLAASAVFLRGQRDQVSRDLYAARNRSTEPTADDEAEDDAIESRERTSE
ncbi:DUF4229 domain-containing protein [Agromyces sp. LHK192]|uniref:DUF4229 domain-containing protein n=1 Tax=Agromyces sp. LHK192 TaxID=2498704 RepID=UPI000FD7F9F8|nr:DUF4229 domain-containing protein [Agromyces sp. LHK192]